jgi:hypothetical protein
VNATANAQLELALAAVDRVAAGETPAQALRGTLVEYRQAARAFRASHRSLLDALETGSGHIAEGPAQERIWALRRVEEAQQAAAAAQARHNAAIGRTPRARPRRQRRWG